MSELAPIRIHLLRGGYVFMGGGLALVKWPLLPGAHTLPLYEGVTLSLLTAMSLLALAGIRHPLRLLPVLLLEVLWKVIWLGLVALPLALHGDLGPDTTRVLVNCLFVVVVIAAVPWGHVARTYTRSRPDSEPTSESRRARYAVLR